VIAGGSQSKRAGLGTNYLLCAAAGVTWYLQFFFYTMGETQMGIYRFSSWTLHMASIMIFGSLWGIALKEWKGAGIHTMRLLALSLAVLVISTLVVGYGNYLSTIPRSGDSLATKR
jgi:L-rhamnose-H+ transport protein